MSALELKETIEKLGTAFHQFKAANDERLALVEKGQKDPVLEERLAKIDKNLSLIDNLKAQLDAIELKGSRPGRTSDDAVVDEHKEAFNKFIRKGVDNGLGELQQKAVNVSADEEGGYAVPDVLDRDIEKYERDAVPMRGVCKVVQMSGENYKKIINVGGATSGWVGELDARPETATPKLKTISPKFGELYANPAVSQKSLDDMFFDVEKWLAEEVAEEFEEQENAAFYSGDGVDKPPGLMAGTLSTSDDASRTFGEIQYMLSGADNGITDENLIDLIHLLRVKYRRNASFMMSGLMLAKIRKLKNTDGDLIWQPGLQAGVPSSLLSYGVIENDEVAAPGAESNSVLFADFKRAYTIVDIRGTRVLRDPYTNKPNVHFYTTKRVGGMRTNDQAIKVLRLGDGVA